MIKYEWDPAKAEVNIRKHGVSFDDAASAFDDPYGFDWIDEKEDYGEERWNLLGMYAGQILIIVYTERGERIRIISARKAERYEQEIYYSRIAR